MLDDGAELPGDGAFYIRSQNYGFLPNHNDPFARLGALPRSAYLIWAASNKVQAQASSSLLKPPQAFWSLYP